MKKVMITSRSFGSIDDTPMDILKDAGYEIVLRGKDFDQQKFNAEIADYDALVIGAHDFPAEVLAGCKKLKIICKHGAGLDNIPIEAAKAQGIMVCNVPGTNANAVADLTFGLMLCCARQIVAANNRVHTGAWKTITGTDVYAKTLGLLGFGAIAKNVARRAAGFNMKVLAYDPFIKTLPEEFSHVTLCDNIMEVISQCDFLSLHLPLTDETRGMIGAKELSAMKQGAYLINAARGGIVDEKDLYNALVSGRLAAAAMDVSEKEPIDPANPLLTLENVVITPHLGMYSKEAIGAVSTICAQNAAAMLTGEALQFRVV
ncbi:phosphoglycerate dehydrogenase [Oscillospiraceae bacterium LTW-04]|nr:phosphoglycerate dehydrogenase [Oscillospiraceae bacterium MB24-C1]